MQNFIKDRLLKRIERVCPAAFCSRDFVLLHDNAPAHKAASICQFLTPKKCYSPLSSPILSRFISARLFSVPQIENEVKSTQFCGCCWDPRSRNWWITEGPNRGIFGSFSETVRPRKSLYIRKWSLFWVNRRHVSSILKKKSVLKLLDRTVYIFKFAIYFEPSGSTTSQKYKNCIYLVLLALRWPSDAEICGQSKDKPLNWLCWGQFVTLVVNIHI